MGDLFKKRMYYVSPIKSYMDDLKDLLKDEKVLS